ncbi:MAG: Ppx/GppA phosphatase family protein [Pseudomonadota bacterium]
MESLLRSIRPSASAATLRASDRAKAERANGLAPGRLPGLEPVAIIDIGSNSVRLVVYEGLTRSPTPIFNEKALCGLGKSVASTGRLDDEAVEAALSALKRYRVLCDQMQVSTLRVLATAAVREAENGPAFEQAASDMLASPIQVLTGPEEAHYAALGVIAGTYRPHGVAGDLGGGSLELVGIEGDRVGTGVSLPLGGLRLVDMTEGSVKKAARIAQEALADQPVFDSALGQDFFAVGGTFRALATLHMSHRGYPLRMSHGYAVEADVLRAFLTRVRDTKPAYLGKFGTVSSSRASLLPFGAAVLLAVIERMRPARVVFSALGVREGMLYDLLDPEKQARDPLLAAASELGYLRARSPEHAAELTRWTDRLFETLGLDETENEARLRRAACSLADIGWRAHPDYRGEQSLNIIANAAFTGLEHPERAYLALSVYHRHAGTSATGMDPGIRELSGARLGLLARVLAGSFRVAYLVSASMPGVLERTALVRDGDKLVLTLPSDLADIAAPRLASRMRSLAKLLDGIEADIVVGEAVG